MPTKSPPRIWSIVDDDTPERILAAWTHVHAAATACKAVWEGASEGERAELAIIADALGAICAAVTHGEKDALAQLRRWTLQTIKRMPSSVAPDVDKINAWHQAKPALAMVAPPTPQAIAKAVREHLTRAKQAGGGQLLFVELHGPHNAFLLGKEGPEALPVSFSGEGEPRMHTRCWTRWEVCTRALVPALRKIFPPTSKHPDDATLAEAVYRRMPLNGSGHSVDRSGESRHAPFTENDFEPTIVAAFKAAGYPAGKADDLFNSETVDLARKARRPTRPRSKSGGS
jgi:hypothetical protein